MKYGIKTLDNEQSERVRRTFLEQVGNKIRDFREKKNILQTVLGQCLGLSAVSISNYENGVSDMKLSNIPLISMYCDVPISKLLPEDDAQSLINTLSEVIDIAVHRYERGERRRYISGNRVVGKVYEDDLDIVIPVVKRSKYGLKEQYKRCEQDTMAQPYTDQEVYEYIKATKSDIIPIIQNAGQILKYIENKPNKETVRNSISDFIIDEVFLCEYKEIGQNAPTERMYAYYRSLFRNGLNQQ